ncbi:hypothetical protein [Microbacterium kunmingense]|uniref:hypothetical protein n=1 Tax=Microbacterium kunmingense TaxID=2915939 RepID=UPI003D73F3D3
MSPTISCRDASLPRSVHSVGIEAVEVGDELGDSLGESAGEALASVLCVGVVVGVGAGSGAHADSRPRASAAPAITVRERWRVDIDDS